MDMQTVQKIQELEIGDIYEFENFLITQLQNALNTNKFNDCHHILEKCLERHITIEELQKISACKDKLVQFDSDIANSLTETLALTEKNNKIKALYFEYYYDGAEDNTGNFFLCESYTEEDMEWACDFSQVVGNIFIANYFNYDPDIEFNDPAMMLSSMMIANAMLESIHKHVESNTIDYPLYFASHEWSGGAVRII